MTMLSSAATRSFVRSAGKPCAVRALASLGFPCKSDNNWLLQTPSNHLDTRVELPIMFQQNPHPATPVFVGFAPYLSAVPQLPKEDPTTFVETLEEDQDTPTNSKTIIVGHLDESSQETLQMMNRNARSSKKHKANHGKRPNNRQARRSKLIKLGRRRRS